MFMIAYDLNELTKRKKNNPNPVLQGGEQSCGADTQKQEGNVSNWVSFHHFPTLFHPILNPNYKTFKDQA